LHSVEVIAELLDNPALLSGDLVTTGVRQRGGVGIIEAPRGTLIHDYDVGADDLVTRCNLIVSTTHNNQAMNEAVRAVARDYLDGRELTEGLLNHIEVAIRAYDPCLSCATHALGQMPLDVALVGPDGALIDRVVKSQDGDIQRDMLSPIGLQA
jgi:NAD-reducing hydrogenase large subunit